MVIAIEKAVLANMPGGRAGRDGAHERAGAGGSPLTAPD